MRTAESLEQVVTPSATMDTETQQRRAANRRTLFILAAVALAFYIGIMLILVLR